MTLVHTTYCGEIYAFTNFQSQYYSDPEEARLDKRTWVEDIANYSHHLAKFTHKCPNGTALQGLSKFLMIEKLGEPMHILPEPRGGFYDMSASVSWNAQVCTPRRIDFHCQSDEYSYSSLQLDSPPPLERDPDYDSE